jgi:hypothetical protein
MGNDTVLGLVVDKTLTVHTAHVRGYRYVMEVPRQTLGGLRDDFESLMNEHGYKLGKSAGVSAEEGEGQGYLGWYAPISAPSVLTQTDTS